MNYDLEERTTKYSEEIISFCRKMIKNIITIPLIDQLIRCGTSIGANYMEASGASSKKDFRNKIFICVKEAKETKYWLRLLAKTDVNASKEIVETCRSLWKEAQELTLIFSTIARKTKS